MIKLLTHHLLCISKFTDADWYNQEYKKNFLKIVSIIKKNPKIKILRNCDDICKKCPHIKNKLCNKPSKYKISHWIKVQDNKVMRLIKIKPNSIHNARELFEKINKIKNKELKNICKGCEYLIYCLKKN